VKAPLTIEDLSVSYGAVVAVSAVSLEVKAGECVAVVGANGAGKTSVLRGVGGLTKCGGGSRVSLGERKLDRMTAARRARNGLAHVLENRHVFPGLTVRENLVLGLQARGIRPSSLEDHVGYEEVLEVLPELKGFEQKFGGALSGGQQQMVAIGRALIAGPQIVMMDEPTNGLAPILVNRVLEIIEAIRSRGVGVLLVEQRLEVAQAAASRVHILQRGRLGGAIDPADPELGNMVHKAYLS
jgi:ABC-type branched-subunit amino acid transport system ATPase component